METLILKMEKGFADVAKRANVQYKELAVTPSTATFYGIPTKEQADKLVAAFQTAFKKTDLLDNSEFGEGDTTFDFTIYHQL